MSASQDDKALPIAAPNLDGITSYILYLRGQRVLLSHQLAALYGVEVRKLNQAVKRNIDRFPADFMFQVTHEEMRSLRSQFVTLNEQGVDLDEFSRAQFVAAKRGSHSKYLAYAFTEQGIGMLSSVLNSKRAIAVNVEIMRAFVKMRGMLSEHKELSRKLTTLERKYDDQFRVVFDAIRELMTSTDAPKKRQIGFIHDSAKKQDKSSDAPKAVRK